ncbi:MAG: DUF4173 domain-containing protein [Bacteroidetes bacterium]|nr:DUF4173 domain-containing protein [Bacteroidota bacterium]MBU1579278.1 DUF4173 domain-containing protein [Bacteroidota bacterium]MBU2556627.1 DUF4173 domain-containing protein [Bacteroidota bacterium]
MIKTKPFISWILLSVVFTLLFYKQYIGLNFLFFELLLLFTARNIYGCFIQSVQAKILLILLLSSLIAVVIVNSALAIVANIIFLLLLAGWLAQHQLPNLMLASLSVVRNIFTAPIKGAIGLLNVISKQQDGRFRAVRIFLFLIVLLVTLFLFISVYASASPWFGKLSEAFLERINEWIVQINIEWLPTFILGILLTSLFLFSGAEKLLSYFEQKPDAMPLKAPVESTKLFRGGAIVLVISLNLMLLIVNWFDLKNVWLFFEWNGDFLKQFVHEGTYMLLFSVALAAAIMLVIYSNASTTIQKDKWLAGLSYFWIAQNIFLVFSVGMRNYWYMSYFALAYKRIAVVFVLILLLAGLVLLLWKIKNQRSVYWLIKQSSLVFFLIFGIAAIFNWDGIIARYNLAHYQKSFVHFDFLVQLSGKTLPVLDKTKAELYRIEEAQQQLFFLEGDFMNADEFHKVVQKQKTVFLNEQQEKSWLSWNYADYRAAGKLNSPAAP